MSDTQNRHFFILKKLTFTQNGKHQNEFDGLREACKWQAVTRRWTKADKDRKCQMKVAKVTNRKTRAAFAIIN